MAATLTRRVLRRARLGGRHTYRTATRHRGPLLIAASAAIVALATVGVVGELGHDGSPRFGLEAAQPLPGPPAGRMAGPLAGPPAGRMAGPLAGPPAGHPAGPMAGRPDRPVPGGSGGPAGPGGADPGEPGRR